MKTRYFLLILGWVPMLAATAASLSAAQIVDKNVAARGGLQAWRAVNTLTLSGQIDAGGKKNVSLPFVMKLKRPYKSRFEVNFQNQTALQTYDGEQGWKVRPFLGRNEVEPFTTAEAKSAASSTELDGPLVDYARKGTRVELQGMDKVEGHSAYKLKLTMKDSSQRYVWVDAQSYLELKMEGVPRKMDGRMRAVSIYFRDYKTESGLLMAHEQETVVEGLKPGHKMIIQHVAVNQPIDDTAFGKPQLAAADPPTQTAKQTD
ncbi:outer membrane lipoprotein-sorting protein [Vogesella sp. LIG4]|uniref:outer membrane lipoprotein-sorting protein n=1 Tax=Vogesella sp. LIG4 TaxID=1192162 RepID=UPI00081F764A|nr:outer membrane lipoprotein-sorting protein [Vogesella sp. LIG4]SCK24526.1 Outer membrane lipoprotein-sorting protein [Vogesella sp. LIG4]